MSQQSQVSLRTVFTVCAGVVMAGALVYAVVLTQLAITISMLAAMTAVALHHAVTLLMATRLHLRRWSALLLVGVALVAVVTLLGLLIVPPAVRQAQVLGQDLPQLVERIRHTSVFETLDRRLDLSGAIDRLGQEAPGIVLRVVNSVVGLVAAGVSVLVLAVFMLIFGPPLIDRILDELGGKLSEPVRRVLDKIYHAIGGYVAGMTFICWVNTICTMIFLAILRMPFFLPVAILSGTSSLIPYVGSLVTSVLITVLALATLGTWQAVACAVWFVSYGQLEGNVLGPLVFRRTVHVNPLVTTLALLFFGEMAGILGAIVAIPVVAALQVIIREILRARREHVRATSAPPAPPPLNIASG